jgi:predicted dinucleotide-binding enzyme
MGVAIGGALCRLGHDVVFGAREPGRPVASRGTMRTVPYETAAAHGEVLIVALSWSVAREVLTELRVRSKIVISCTNPETDDAPLAVGHHTSAAEEIASWCEGASVVEAFNSIYAERLDDAPELDQRAVTVAYCGDDAAARALTASLIRGLGFDALDAGPLRNARYLEPLAQLVVYLVRQKGLGPKGLTLTFSRMTG